MTHMTPHRRVLSLSFALLLLMGVVVGIGFVGTTRAVNQFDQLTAGEYAAFDNVLHVDRDLFRAQRHLELAVHEADPRVVQNHLDTFDERVASIESRWAQFQTTIEVPAEAEATYADAWILWVDANADIVALLNDGVDVPTALVETSQTNFLAVRTVAHDLEEEIVEPSIEEGLASLQSTTTNVKLELGGLLALGLIAGALASWTTYRAVKNGDRERAVEAKSRRFHNALAQSLDMAQAEESLLETVSLVLDAELPTHGADLLLADSSQAHLHPAASTEGEHSHQGCGVVLPRDCPAIRRGSTIVIRDSADYWACPQLRERGDAPDCSAVCVPISIAGKAQGVLNLTGPRGHNPTEEFIAAAETISSQSGDRLGVIRAFARSEAQAATDPLTGLLNRRSFENEAADLLRADGLHVLAYADVDLFKALNDTHGHDVGDRALRLYARTLRSTLRSEDLVARWGGEEFVILFHDVTIEAAIQSIERLRESLQRTLASGTTPPFTVSYGVAITADALDLDELVTQADSALLEAKRTGRDRIIRWGSWDENATDAAAPAPERVSSVTS